MRSGNTPWDVLIIVLNEVIESEVDLDALRATIVTIHLDAPIEISKFSPLLRHAEGIVTNKLPDWGSLPWIRLRKLRLRLSDPGYSYEDSRNALISILRSAPYLIQLNFDFKINGTPVQPNGPLSIAHSKLEILSVPLSHFTGNGILFGVELDVPSLTSVLLRSLKRLRTAEQDTFYRLWSTPRQLDLFIYDNDAMESAELVRWYPSVDTLIIEEGETEAFFIFMYTLLDHAEINPSTSPLPLPNLTTLRIENTDLRGETLLALINARIRHIRKNTPGMRALTSIEMYETPGVTPEDWRLVLEKLEEGRHLNSQISQ